jgi:hypothetical protein
MEPSRDTRATLVDLLDRILDKGLVINADLIVSVAGIPLLGVNVRAALAGMETMLKYGVMQDWDQKSRAWESEHRKKALPILAEGEKIDLKLYGSYYYNKGIYQAWRPGYFYLTDKRLILYRQDFDEITFQIPLEEIKALAVKEEEHFVKEKKKPLLYLMDKQDGVHRLSSVEANQLKEAVERKIKDRGLCLEENPVFPECGNEQIIGLLMEEEKIIHQGKEKVWYLVPAEGIQQETWRPGHLYLTDKRLFWWSDFDKKIVFECTVESIVGVGNEMRKTSGLNSKKEKVLYVTTPEKDVASFSGDQTGIDDWEKVLVHLTPEREEMETCPGCGERLPAKELLEKGCPSCNWTSPLLKKKNQGVIAG